MGFYLIQAPLEWSHTLCVQIQTNEKGRSSPDFQTFIHTFQDTFTIRAMTSIIPPTSAKLPL